MPSSPTAMIMTCMAKLDKNISIKFNPIYNYKVYWVIIKQKDMFKGFFMRDTKAIIEEFNTLTDDKARQKYLLQIDNETNDANVIPDVLKCLKPSERLAYIRQEDSSTTEYGDITNPKFKYINYIIYCDLYLEHLTATQYSQPTYSPELTEKKIEIIEGARAILLDKPESKETLQAFYDDLVDHQEDLAKRRDTQFTSFLKSIGLIWLVDYAYSSLFVKTDGKVLIEKIEAIDQLPTNKP